MNVIMRVIVSIAMGGCSHHDDLTMPDAAFRHHVLGEVLNLLRGAFEHVHLHAAVMVEVDVE